MKKSALAILALTTSFWLTACDTPPKAQDPSSANKTPAQWQQFRSQKGVEELDSNTRQIDGK